MHTQAGEEAKEPRRTPAVPIASTSGSGMRSRTGFSATGAPYWSMLPSNAADDESAGGSGMCTGSLALTLLLVMGTKPSTYTVPARDAAVAMLACVHI
ncbi:hypothetical protein EON66_06435 [archaeon]|nr:MAG: hypothetical protein EON66_06435 [archaeon]